MNCSLLEMTLLGMLGTQELLIIFVIVLFLFGAKKIPQLARGIASSLVEFKKGKNEYPSPSPKNDKPNDPT